MLLLNANNKMLDVNVIMLDINVIISALLEHLMNVNKQTT